MKKELILTLIGFQNLGQTVKCRILLTQERDIVSDSIITLFDLEYNVIYLLST